jgi:hypothetical protein
VTSRIACTALTGRIMSGRVNKSRDAFIGVKSDVTSDVLKAVIDKAAFHGGSFDVEGGDEKWVITVVKAAASLPTPHPEDVEGNLLEEVRRKAARYDWLRMQEWFDGPLCVLRDPKRVLTQGIGLGADCPSHERLDAAIDAAMAAEVGSNG